MTKQEKIREWYKDALSGYGCPDTYLENETDKLFTYLHSQGVVIKKNNIKYVTAHRDGNAFITTVAVEPLVKE